MNESQNQNQNQNDNLQPWLDNLCRMLPRVASAVYLPAEDANPCVFPTGSSIDEDLVAAANLAGRQGAPVTSLTHSGESQLLVAFPMQASGSNLGVVAVRVAATQQQQEAVLQLLGWSESWLALLQSQTHPNQISVAHVDFTPDIQNLSASYLTLVSHLADLWRVDKVSLGLLDQGKLTIVARSYQAEVDHRLNIMGVMASAMDEALQQQVTIYDGMSQNDNINLFAHNLLSDAVSTENTCTLPLLVGDNSVGALLLHRAKPAVFSGAEVASLVEQSRHLALMLQLLEAGKPGRLARVFSACRTWFQQLTGRGHSRTKLTTVIILAVILILGLVPGEYDINARATVEGLEQKVVVVPFDGYIKQASSRAGDSVGLQQVLAEMEDRDLQQELNEVNAEWDGLNREYRQALSDLNQAESRIQKARLAQVSARRELVNYRLSQIQLRSPMNGVIISGDLSRSLGAPVSRGTVLFEIAPLSGYRMALYIKESDIDEIIPGQSGFVILNSHPDTKIPINIERVSAVLDSGQEQGVVFRAEATIPAEFDFMRPGMQGTARIAMGDRKLGWILFHDVINWFRLMTWQYLP